MKMIRLICQICNHHSKEMYQEGALRGMYICTCCNPDNIKDRYTTTEPCLESNWEKKG